MKNNSTITERGQITIPKKLRERFGLRTGMRVRFVPSRRGVLIERHSKASAGFRKAFGIVKDRERTDAYLKRVRGSAE